MSMVYALAVNSAGTLLASASHDKHVRLWRISDRRTVALFSQSHAVNCITFSMDGKYILCGGRDDDITEWSIPEDVLFGDRPNAQTSSVSFSLPAIPLFPSDPSKGNFANGHCRGVRDKRCKFATVSDPTHHRSLISMRRLQTTTTRHVFTLYSRMPSDHAM